MHRVLRFVDGRKTTEERNIVREFPLSIIVNGQDIVTLACTPDTPSEYDGTGLLALVLGFLRSEGLVKGRNQVESVEFEQNTAVVALRENCFEEGSASPHGNEDEGVASLPCSQVTDLMLQMSRISESYREHGGIHTAALSDGLDLLIVAEDLGKLNALDKIVGQSMIRGIPMRGKVLLCSGRITAPMLAKAERMGIPIVISRSSPTDLAVERAGTAGITVVGYARGNSCRVYSHDHRITDNE